MRVDGPKKLSCIKQSWPLLLNSTERTTITELTAML